MIYAEYFSYDAILVSLHINIIPLCAVHISYDLIQKHVQIPLKCYQICNIDLKIMLLIDLKMYFVDEMDYDLP